MGLQAEDRVLLCMHDGLHWPVAFLGCILAGVVPVAVNTLLTSQDYLYMLQDSRAQALLVSAPLCPVFEPVISQLNHPLKIISDKTNTDLGYTNIDDFIKQH